MSVPKTRMYFPLKGIADQRLIYKFLYTLPLNFKANAPDSSEWESWVSFGVSNRAQNFTRGNTSTKT